jgi:DNA-directed RNA polymerase subunit L
MRDRFSIETFINKPFQKDKMEFAVVEETKTKLVFDLKGETHTFCNLLKDELLNTKGVVTASYRVDHPLIGVPRFMVETKGVEPRKALKDALAALKKKAESFKKAVAEF